MAATAPQRLTACVMSADELVANAIAYCSAD